MKTGGSPDNIANAMALILQAREKLITAKQFLVDDGRLVPVMTCEDALAQLVVLLGEVGAA